MIYKIFVTTQYHNFQSTQLNPIITYRRNTVGYDLTVIKGVLKIYYNKKKKENF